MAEIDPVIEQIRALIGDGLATPQAFFSVEPMR
jgi:hypothetical protein